MKRKRRGRPKTGHEMIAVRVEAGTKAAIEKWAAEKRLVLSFSQAVRALIMRGLGR